MFRFNSVLYGYNARYEGHPLKAKARPVSKPVVRWSRRALQRISSHIKMFVLSPELKEYLDEFRSSTRHHDRLHGSSKDLIYLGFVVT